MKTSTKTRTYRRKLFMQKVMGLGLIAIGIMACILEPQEGGAALIMIGGLGAWMVVSRKQLIY